MSILDDNLTPDGSISPGMRTALVGMSPWLRFIGLTGLIFSSMAFIFVLIMLVAGGALAAFSKLGAFGALPSFVFIIYLAFIGLAIYLYYLLYQAGSHLQRFGRTNDYTILEEAFVKQKTFWTIVGVITAIYLGFLALGLLFGIIAAIFM